MRSQPILSAISNVLPLSYAVDAMKSITTSTVVTTQTWVDLLVVFGSLSRRWCWVQRRCSAGPSRSRPYGGLADVGESARSRTSNIVRLA